MKAINVSTVKNFEDIPNVGPAMARDFALLGIKDPKELKGKSAFALYKKLCTKSGSRQDPCVLDTYLAVIDFMNGAAAKPWWHYTKMRKAKYPHI